MLRYTLKGFCLLVFSMYASISTAQNEAIGTWRTHFPWSTGLALAQDPSFIYVATRSGIYSIDRADNSLSLYTKVNALNGSTIRAFGRNEANGAFLVAYEDSGIDILKDGKATLLVDIKNASITGDKRINHISFDGQIAYLSCGFGLLKLDMATGNVLTTAFTGFALNGATIMGDSIFVAASNGIYSLRKASNLADIGNWRKHGPAQGLASIDFSSQAIATAGNLLYADVRDTLRKYDNGRWSHVQVTIGGNPQSFTNVNASSIDYDSPSRTLMLTNGSALPIVIDANMNLATLYPPNDFSAQAKQMIRDSDGNFWVADAGFGAYKCNTSLAYTHYKPNGPRSEGAYDMEFTSGGELWVTPGGADEYYIGGNGNQNGVFKYNGESWENINGSNQGIFSGKSDVLAIANNPLDGTLAMCAYRDFLAKYSDGNFSTIPTVTSQMSSPGGSTTSDIRTTGLAYDAEGNLWVSNYLAAGPPIHAYTKDGTWVSFNFDQGGLALFNKMLVDRNNYKWILMRTGVFVMDTGKKDPLTDKSDDRQYVFTTSNSNLPTTLPACIAEDKDGEIWVGTPQGIVIYSCGSQTFTGQCRGERPVVERDGFRDYLFKAESVQSIAVDGANRKWIGTSNGVFLVSEDGLEQLVHFTTENSPLVSNNVTALAIDGMTGEVYIGTDMGIVAYRAEATEGSKKFTDVFAYPNPVRPDYEGPIAIKGLVQDADVRITDAHGTLVYTSKSLGGQFIWDGRDYNGRKVQTGVYLVFANNENGFQTMVTKLVFVN